MMQDVDVLSRYYDSIVAMHIGITNTYRHNDEINRVSAYSE